MSFGTSLSDAAFLVQLAWTTVENARKACGEFDELTLQVSALHVVLQRLQSEELTKGRKDRPESSIHEKSNTYKDELQAIVDGCEKVLGTLDKILHKYNGLSEQERGGKPRMLWKKVRFGNGEMADLGDLRGKVVYYTSLASLFLNMRSSGSIGKVEQQMNDAGGDLKEIKSIVNGIAAAQIAQEHQEGSVLSAYANDDRSAWRDVRRELRQKHGFHDVDLRKHKTLIVEYMKELGDRGILDDIDVDRKAVAVTEDDTAASNEAASAAYDVPEDLGQRHSLHQEPAKKPSAYKNPAVTGAALYGWPSTLSLRSAFEASRSSPYTHYVVFGGERQYPLIDSLRKRFDEEYLPRIRDFLWAPPTNEESSKERCRVLSQEVLTNIVIKLTPVDHRDIIIANGLFAVKSIFAKQVLEWLANLEEAANENTAQWLVGLCENLYYGSVAQIKSITTMSNVRDGQKQELYAVVERKISQDLILLNDIEVGGFHGLRIIKGLLKDDLKAMQNFVSLAKKEGSQGWSWLNLCSSTPTEQIPRVKLVIDWDSHTITSQNASFIHLIRPSTIRWFDMKNNPQEACVSCRHSTNASSRRLIFPCNHKWCEKCIRNLLSLSERDDDFMPPKCCTPSYSACTPAGGYMVFRQFPNFVDLQVSENYWTRATLSCQKLQMST